MKKLLTFGFLCLSTLLLQAQSGLKKHMAERAEKKQAAIDAGAPFLSTMVGPGYTPDNGFLIGGGFLYTFKTNRSDSLIQRSSFPITAFISTKGNIGLNNKITSFWNEDRIRFNMTNKLFRAQDNYFGVGYASSEQIDIGEKTSEYKKTGFVINPEFQYRIVKNLYAGAIVDINKVKVREANEIMTNDPSFIKYGPSNFNLGVGFSINFDSRDLTVNAYSGHYGRFAYTNYSKGIGSDNNYAVYETDLRTYHQIGRDGKTFAVRLFGRFAVGNVPYAELSTLGGNDALRGYLTGKYIDKTTVFIIPEYRYMFLKNDGAMSKHGLVTWAGLGTIAPSVSDIKKFVPNIGLGYRFEVQPRMNVRIDYGIGKESSGLYFNFTESF